MPSKLPQFTCRFKNQAEIRMVAKAAAKLRISMNHLVTEAAREVAKIILAEEKLKRVLEGNPNQLIESSSQLTLNQ